MSSVQYMREFICKRLSAAAEEIFGVFEKMIVQYEEEIARQRRLLDMPWKSEFETHTIDLPQQHVCKEEEVLGEQQLCNQERDCSLDQEEPEPPQTKEEEKELCTSQEGEQLVVKQETVTFEERDCSELKPNNDQLLCHMSPAAVRQISHSNMSVRKEEVVTDNQLCNQERNSSQDQEEPEPQQIKEEEEELCTSQEGEQLVLKQETYTLMVTPTYEKSDRSEPKPNRDQLLSHNSPVAESQDQEGSNHVDSGSTRNAEVMPKMRHNTNRSHSNNADNSPMTKSQHNTDTGKKSVKCGICGKAFQYKSRLMTHLRVHTGVKPYACKTCGKSFRSSDKLLVHVRIHTGEKPYSCKTCGKSFRSNDKLLVHFRTHTGEKPYSCQTCGKSFCRSTQLTVHTRTHTGEKPYSCKTCGKSFCQGGSLTLHMKTHTGEALYLCKTCGKTFIDSSTFKRHTAIHTGEKPYSCKMCGKRFSQSSNMTVHMRTHTGEKPYSCKTCGKSFSRSCSLTIHMRTHTGEKS